jgi:nucleotide-binding universal stress UspA family protein
MKVLLAVDGSDYTKRMLAYLAAHPDLLGQAPELTVYHGLMAIPPHAAAAVGSAQVRHFHETELEKVFRPIRAFFAQQGVAASFVHHVGPVADGIADHAQEGRFDLIVMGSHGHGELAGMVMGSVATRVLARCKVPVLLIR